MKSDHFVTTLARMGQLQPHHVQASAWLSELPPCCPVWNELSNEWINVVKYQHAPVSINVRKFVMNPIHSRGTFPLNDHNIGLFREALNAAYHVMTIEAKKARH